ncbi:MAG: error-prone DNA polymerase [Aeromicrobium sp.]
MGWSNPDVSWRELERRMSGKPDGGDGPAFSRKRDKYVHEPIEPPPDAVPYAELHCHSSYSFLDGASEPSVLVEEAVRLGLTALAITDHDGFYGAVRLAEAAQEYPSLSTIYGAELSLGLTAPQNGVPDPEGTHLLVLARGVEGYHRLAGAITEAQLRGDEKGRPAYDLDELAARADGHWQILTGCRKGLGRTPEGLDALVDLFGRDNVAVELIDHGHPGDDVANDGLAAMAAARGLPIVATNNVHFATPADRRLAQSVAAVRARRSLAELDGWLPASGQAFLRSGLEMQLRFARYSGAVAHSLIIASECAFDLRKASPRLPKQDVPPGHTPMTWLRELVRQGADRLYADNRDEAEERLQKELAVIEDKDFPGYFLIVHDIVAFARSRGILCQGRGSAANSAVCFALGITAVDSILYGLPFERFLSETRDDEPDIDVDFDSDRREEVIQWVYEKYGRRNAAQVANVITYRPRSAVRDMAKALGYSVGQQDAWSKGIDSWSSIDAGIEIPGQVLDLANQLLKAPRHLGIHSGGMVLTERPVGEVVPIERGRMDNRTVLQWDKDDCAWMGLVKFDLLGLGMLGAIQHTFDLVAAHTGVRWELATIPKEEPAVYDMLCKADSIGVFQVESRAQIGTLPRLKPRCFYDLVTEIALIRPGPIQGGAVHPYIRRRTGEEPIDHIHPALEPVLKRTLGVPLFQEQLMQIAMTVGNCTGAEADLLRRAMGSKRGVEKIERLRTKLYDGMASYGIEGELADSIYARIEAFANFGFAESHAISFALLVYASSWLKLHYPAAFLAALLRSQPMGFYSPQSLVGDARRHGVEIRRPCIARSGVWADLEALPGDASLDIHASSSGCIDVLVAIAASTSIHSPSGGAGDACMSKDAYPPVGRGDAGFAVRLGLTEVRGLGEADAERIVAARADRPFTDMADVVRRTGLSVAQMEALATAGAFDSFGITRRQALWNAGYTDAQDRLQGTAVVSTPPTLPGMNDIELTAADLWSTHISPDEHPMAFMRKRLAEQGILSVGDTATHEADRRIRVAGLITHRQRPSTAGGVTFLNLEDETGMLNVVVFGTVWQRNRRVARNAAGVIIRGRLERKDNVVNLVAEAIEPLPIPIQHKSRDFR